MYEQYDMNSTDMQRKCARWWWWPQAGPQRPRLSTYEDKQKWGPYLGGTLPLDGTGKGAGRRGRGRHRDTKEAPHELGDISRQHKV